MNEGAPLDRVVQEVQLPVELLEKPYLRPTYDEPEFVVRNIWRQYGGWYDGNPSRLKPAPDVALAAEVAGLAGGARALAERGHELAAAGETRLATHLVEMAGLAAPEDGVVHARRAEVYRQRRKEEASLMAKGIFGDAARRSEAVVGEDQAP